MWMLVDRFGRILVDAALATTVMLSVVVLLQLLCRQPVRRITTARAAMLMAVFMASLVTFHPFPRINPFAWLRDPVSPSPVGDPEWWQNPWLLRAIALSYLGTVAFGLVWLLLGFLAVWAIIRGSEGPQPRTRTLYRELLGAADVGPQVPELRISRRIKRPILAHLFRAYIVIPRHLEDPSLDAESLRLILVHELAHAQGRDARLSALASLAQTLWFFLPFIHWLRAQLRIDQEFLADQRAVALAGSSAHYASRLVALARGREAVATRSSAHAQLRAGDRPPAGLRFTPLLQRVTMLLKCPYPLEARSPRSWQILSPAFVVLLGCLCSCLSLMSLESSPVPAASVSPSAAPAGNFHVDYFLAAPRGSLTNGRSLPHVLPLPLPPQFLLTVEIEVPRAALGRMRIAGLPLDPPAMASGELPSPLTGEAVGPDRHRVLIRRTRERIELSVDDANFTPDPSADPLTEWLTIEPPPDQTAVLRNLDVRW